MPFVVVNVDEEQFATVQSQFSGHNAIKHIGKSQAVLGSIPANPVEEDKEMRTQ
jgi:hypothetical protein